MRNVSEQSIAQARHSLCFVGMRSSQGAETRVCTDVYIQRRVDSERAYWEDTAVAQPRRAAHISSASTKPYKQRVAALSESFRIYTMSGYIFNRMSAFLVCQGAVVFDTKAISAPIDRTDGTVQRELKKRISIDRRKSQFACEAEGAPARQQSLPLTRATTGQKS
jgi:hypothetical protein